MLDFTAISTTGRWVEQRWHSYEWVDLMLETTDMSAGLSFEFEGHGLQSRLTMANDQLNFTTDWMKGNGPISIAIAWSGAVLMDGIVCLIAAMSLNKASIGSSLY